MPGVSQGQQPGYRGPKRFFLRGESDPQCQGSCSPQAAGATGPGTARPSAINTLAQCAIQGLGCICCSALDVNCGIGTCLPGGQVADSPDAFRLCSSPGRRARLLAAAIFLLGLMSARGAW